jgi:cytoskeletal protein RodZ
MGDMSAVAQQLRQAREAKNLTVQQVVEITKIRTDHLIALEEGNFDVFSAPVYIRGFVRTYSTLLKLDVQQVMAALDAELAGTTKFAEPPPLADHPRGVLDFVMLQLSLVDWRKASIGLAVVAVVVIGFSAWLARRDHDPLKGLKPAVYQPTQHVSGDTLPVPAPTQPRR